MKRTSILSATILALALPLSAGAQTWTPGENFLTNWDRNGDGQVTAEEVLERRGDLFDGFDTDENGVLSAEEFADHNAMRDAMQNSQDRPAWNGGARWSGPQQGQPGMYGPGGQGRQVGRNTGGGRYMMQQQAPGWGSQQGYFGRQGFGPQQGYGPQMGWGMQQGYGPQMGWGMPQGFGPQQGCCPQMGYAGPGYGPQMGWGMQQGYGQPGYGPQNMNIQMQNALDADGNGEISRDEFVAAGEGWLPRFDRNGDGTVNLDDFAQGYRWQ